MSRKAKTIIAAGVLLSLGGVVAALSQTDGGHHHGRWMGGHHYHHGWGRGPDGSWAGGFGRVKAPLTRDEFDARTRERFARLDRNNDGVIEAAEVEAAATSRMNEGPMSRMKAQIGQRLLRRFDANRDGKVTREEFLAGVRARFAELDLNNDGRITDDDLPPLMRGRGVLSGGAAATGPMLGWMGALALLRDADANKDGVIGLDEALAAAERRFAGHDRNKDGVLDTTDGDTLRKEIIDYRIQRFIHFFGADRDGRITREQFAAKAGERFARMDLDNNGVISRDEMPGRWWRMGRGGRGGEGPGHPDHGRGGDAVGPGPERGPGLAPGKGPRGSGSN